MPDLNYNHLRYFWVVAHEGNLTRAAARLNVSQSALSVQIHKLEHQVGHALFDRSGKKLVLTEAGRIALDYADTIFDAGRNRAGLASAEATRDIAVAQYERAIQQAFRDVADALAGRAFFGDQLAAQAKVVEAESVRYRLAKLRYDNGVSSYLDLLDAQRSLFAAQQALVQARLARLQNQVALYRSLGGGWTEPGTAAAQR